MRLGVFGGTFNPIHFGHLRTAEEVLDKGRLEKIIYMPSGNPPLKTRELADAAHRHAMTCMATGTNPGFEVSDLEVKRRGKSYTVNTIRLLMEAHPGDELFFILGLDAFLDMPNWRSPEELTSLLDFLVVDRPGYDINDIGKLPFLKSCQRGEVRTPPSDGCLSLHLKSGRTAAFVPVTRLDISSTMIRALALEGNSMKYLLPEKVEDYIIKERLYREI